MQSHFLRLIWRNGIAAAMVALLLTLAPMAPIARAHHSSLLYDNDTLLTLTGEISAAKFGFPHSRYKIKVKDGNQSIEWLMTAQDVDDAKRFGYHDQLKALKVGDKITFVGWPHKHNRNEILGHKMFIQTANKSSLSQSRAIFVQAYIKRWMTRFWIRR